jgi:hypothetical protein
MAQLILNDFSPKDVCFWSGAGISSDPPSSLPCGALLTQKIIDHFCLSGTYGVIEDVFKKAELLDASGSLKNAPRLEAVLESITQITGNEALDYLSCLDAFPNKWHKIFAWHLSKGGNHITTNFDDCISKAYNFDDKLQIIDGPWTNPAGPNTLIHLHGRYKINDPDNLSKIGARLNNLVSGFSPALSENLLNFLTKKKLLIFIGYSGSDYFDVNPFFYEIARRTNDHLRGLNVIWIGYGKTVKTNFIMECLRKCGANILGSVTSKEFFEKVSKLPPSDTYGDLKDDNKPIAPFRVLNYETKLVATANLYLSMGLGYKVLELHNELDAILNKEKSARLHNQVCYIINEGLREIGYYRQANQVLSAFSLNSETDRLKKCQRVAGGYWLMGADLRAIYYFSKCYLLGKKKSTGFTAEEQDSFDKELFEAAVRFLHFYRDLNKKPLFKYLIHPHIFLCVFRFVLNQREILQKSSYDKAHLRRLHMEIPGTEPKIQLPEWQSGNQIKLEDIFSETDNILGTVNYSRWYFNKNWTLDNEISKSDILLLLKRSIIINNHPSVLKWILLVSKRGALEVKALKHAWPYLKSVEWTWQLKLSWTAMVFYYNMKKSSECSYKIKSGEFKEIIGLSGKF